MRIEEVTDHSRDDAVELLAQFFREEGFGTPRPDIERNLSRMLADASCWAALASGPEGAAGVITVTTMLCVEWGRLAEIGDLYVVPDQRRRGVARRMVDAAIAWCRRERCSGIIVTITPDGENRHRLSRFYSRMGLATTGRIIWSMPLPD